MNPWLVKNFLYPTVFPIIRGASGRTIIPTAERWEERAKWAPERARQDTFERIQKMVAHAHANVPFYRKRYQAIGFEPGDLKTWEDFAKLPVVKKSDLILNLDEMTAENIPAERRELHQTSGSTGEPTKFWIDKDRYTLVFANAHMNLRWIGMEVGERQSWMWPAKNGPTGRSTWSRRLPARLINRQLLLSPNVDEDVMAIIHGRMKRFRPKSMVSFPTRIVHYIHFLESRGIDPIRMQGIICTGETLFSHQRRDFKAKLRSPIFNRYGSIEMGDIAHECTAHEGMHVNTHRVWVETTPEPTLSEKLGMIVATDLDNLATPFIRYETGDIGEMWDEGTTHDCPCGLRLPRIADVQGRVRDVLEAPSGRIYERLVYSHIADDTPGINLFQVVRKGPKDLTVRVQVDERFPADGREQIIRNLNGRTNGEFDITVELVDEIETTVSGKLRLLVREWEPPTNGG